MRGELERTVAEIHGATGALVRWTVSGPVAARDSPEIVERHARVRAVEVAPPAWRPMLADAPEWRVCIGPAKGAAVDGVWFAYADVVVPDATAVEFTLTVAATADVWLNGKSLYHRAEAAADRNAVARFTGELTRGGNRVLVRAGSARPAVEFGLTFRRKSALAMHEKLTQAALAQAGNAERGRQVFLDAEKSLCLKCHRIGDRGERVGPELTGIGARFGRVYLVESILDPGRAVVPGFATLRVELKDGRVVTGVKVAEADATLTLVDQEIKRHELKKADILEQRTLAASAMPEGLERRLTEQEFVDLVAYLVSLKDRGPSK
jgi:putative heme-binding domain-containing protein